MKKIVILFLLTSCLTISKAQFWQPVADTLNQSVRLFFADTILDELVISGTFSFIDSVQLYGMTKYNGTRFSTLSDTILPIHQPQIFFNPTFGYINYHGKPYISNGNLFNKMEGDSCSTKLAVLENHHWQNAPFRPQYPAVFMFQAYDKLVLNNYVDNSLTNKSWLYTFSDITNQVDSVSIGHYNQAFGQITCAQTYHGQTYLAGNFVLDSLNKTSIVTWDGDTIFTEVGGGIKGINHYVSDMAVINDELYVVGGFLQQAGNASDYIMKWNGNEWLPIPSPNLYINAITVHNNILYACGPFTQAGGSPATGVAYFDGILWHSLDMNFVSSSILTIEVYHDTLYIGGSFQLINSDSIFSLAKYTGTLPVGLNSKTKINNKSNVYPNPTQEIINIEYYSAYSQNIYIDIYDFNGTLILSNCNSTLKGSNRFVIDIKNIAVGIYFIVINDGENPSRYKFIKL